MLTQLKDEVEGYEIDITQIPLTLDSWCVSEPLRQQLYALGFDKIIIAGKGNYTFIINNYHQQPQAAGRGMEKRFGPRAVEVGH